MEKLGQILKAGVREGTIEKNISGKPEKQDNYDAGYKCSNCRDIHYMKHKDKNVAIPCPFCLPRTRFDFKNYIKEKGNGKAFNSVYKWANKQGTPFVILIGAYGTGKTHLCRASYRNLMNQCEHVRYIYSIDLFDSLRSVFNSDDKESIQSIEQEYISPDHLIIDDMGSEKFTEWTRERYERIINKRYEYMLRTLISSNLSMHEITEWSGAIASRLKDKHLSTIIYLSCADFREREIAINEH